MSNDHSVLSYTKLCLNMDYPDLEMCYQEGYEAAIANHDESMNPFVEGSFESEQWLEGWWDGFYQIEPLYAMEQIHEQTSAANEKTFDDVKQKLLFKVFEWSAFIAAAAAVGYQVVDLVA